MESVGRLAGGIAHDFNNMLGVILGHTELALEQLDPQNPLHADLVEIRKAASRSAELTRQLLAFARKQTVAPRVLDLNDTVTGMFNMLRRMIRENIELVWVPEKNLWPIKMDPSQVDQVLANLCVNSCDAIKTTGKITITTAAAAFDQDYCDHFAGFEPGQYVRLAVSDDGCGMDRETIAHIFEPFFTTKQVGQGTGLGLATVYGIVKQNGGYINVSSEPGLGATFSIYLPRHQGPVETTQIPGPAGSVGGPETILLVEDEPGILNIGALMLEKLGYAVLPAGTPAEALKIARQHPAQIHLLMTDVVMPKMNGRELAREILALHPDIKLLYMSGYTSDVIATHGVLDQGVHFIQKPFSSQTLDAKVREAIRSEKTVIA
jgi:CheY-like chemotaxis protein